ncbi:MAG TPA: BlaI/MecI/CopY family transcriptional regulator [Chitinophagaceae bacterium]|nr:BlaI/MecI/CopY family transcriptional regulator [Chitinophagaceae bacterium]
MDKLTKQEREAMLAMWKTGTGTVQNILENHEKPVPHKNTLASTLKNLEKKGLVQHRQIGNLFEYTPSVTKTAYLKTYYKSFLSNFFDNSVESLLSFIAKDKKLSQEDIDQIKQILNKK